MSSLPLNQALDAFVQQDAQAGSVLLRLIRQHCMDADAPHPVEDFTFRKQFRAIDDSVDAATALAIGNTIVEDCVRIAQDPALPFPEAHASLVVEKLLNTLFLRGISYADQEAGMPAFQAYRTHRTTVVL